MSEILPISEAEHCPVSKMVERVARALEPDLWSDATRRRYSGFAVEYASMIAHSAMRARRAIIAMRDPTLAMLHAGLLVSDGLIKHPLGRAYNAMIDAALSDAPVSDNHGQSCRDIALTCVRGYLNTSTSSLPRDDQAKLEQAIAWLEKMEFPRP